MTDFLTIAGTPYQVLTTSAEQSESERLGSARRAFSGGLRASLRTPKRTWTFDLLFLTTAAEITFRTAVDSGAFVTMGGDATNGVSVTVQVLIRRSVYEPKEGIAHYRVTTISVTEV